MINRMFYDYLIIFVKMIIKISGKDFIRDFIYEKIVS